MIRTSKIPFVESRSSNGLLISTGLVTLLTILISFTGVAGILDLAKLPIAFLGYIVLLIVVYIVLIEIYKKIYLKKNPEWL